MLLLSTIVALLFATIVRAQQQYQYGFLVPDQNKTDFDSSLTLTQNKSLVVSWRLPSEQFAGSRNVIPNHLTDKNFYIAIWLTSFNDDKYTQCLDTKVPAQGPNLRRDWQVTINITDADIDANEGKFLLRLKQPSDTYSCDVPYFNASISIPSRGFQIRKVSDTGSPTSPVVVTSVISGVTTLITQTGNAESGSSSSGGGGSGAGENTTRGNLSDGAKAGIAVGTVVPTLVAVVFVFLIIRRRKDSMKDLPEEDNNSASLGDVKDENAGMVDDDGTNEKMPVAKGKLVEAHAEHRVELEDQRPELHGDHTVELEGDRQFRPQELDAAGQPEERT